MSGILIIGGQAAIRAAKAQRDALLLENYGGDPPPATVLRSTLNAWLKSSPVGRDLTRPVGTATWNSKYDEAKGGRHTIVPHSPEELEYCKRNAAQLPKDTVLVALVPEEARKAFILVTGIVWKDPNAAEKYYEIPV